MSDLDNNKPNRPEEANSYFLNDPTYSEPPVYAGPHEQPGASGKPYYQTDSMPTYAYENAPRTAAPQENAPEPPPVYETPYVKPEVQTASSIPKEPPAKVNLEITKTALVLILVFCMLATSGLTIFGMSMYKHFTDKNGTATNYTLTTSKESLSYSSIVKKTQDSVVSITTESVATDSWAGNYITQGAGSGVIIQKNGYILTCNHVISGATKITVTTRDQKEYSASVVGADAKNDIAVIKINADNLSAATYGDSSKLEVGDQVVAIGNPLGKLGGTATTGIISATNRNLNIENSTLNLLQTDASINPGNSGGALFDASGNLIGIVVAKSAGSDIEGLGFAIPINTAAELAKDMIKNGKTKDKKSITGHKGTAIIGVSIVDLSSAEASQYSLDKGGIYVVEVTTENATKAGIQSGDIITSLNGTPVSTSEELMNLVQKHKPGDTVEVGIYRNGQNGSVKVVLSKSTD